MSRRKELRIVFFDIETTGFSRVEDSILEVAAIVIDENYNIVDQYDAFINPGRPIPYKITQLTGINDSMVRTARSENVVLNEFMAWVKKYNPDYVAGHNIKKFDLNWMEEKTAKYNISNSLRLNTIDTLEQVTKLYKDGVLKNYTATTEKGNTSFKMEHLVRYFNLSEQTHRAIDDVMQNIIIYKNLKELEETIDYGF